MLVASLNTLGPVQFSFAIVQGEGLQTGAPHCAPNRMLRGWFDRVNGTKVHLDGSRNACFWMVEGGTVASKSGRLIQKPDDARRIYARGGILAGRAARIAANRGDNLALSAAGG